MKKKKRRILKPKNPAAKLKLKQSRGTALDLLNDLNRGVIRPENLTDEQRKACLVIAANGKRSQNDLALLFKVSQRRIRKDLMEIRQQLGEEVLEWDLQTVIGDLALAKERAMVLAARQEDAGLQWTIAKEFAKTLVDLGVVAKKNEREGFELTIKAVGDRYENAAAALTQSIDPLISGVVQAQGIQAKKDTPAIPTLDIEDSVPGAPVPDRRGVDPDAWPDLEPI